MDFNACLHKCIFDGYIYIMIAIHKIGLILLAQIFVSVLRNDLKMVSLIYFIVS